MELNACGVNSPLSVIGSVLNDAPSGVLVVARNSRLLFVSKLLLFVNVAYIVYSVCLFFIYEEVVVVHAIEIQIKIVCLQL